MLRKVYFSFIIFTALLGSCSFNKAPKEIFSAPNWESEKPSAHQKKIIIASTHNFKGSLYEKDVPYTSLNGLSPNKLKVGGVAVLKTYLDILKYRYGKDLILLDTGHIFDLKKPEEKETVLKIYKEFEYDAVNLTDIDFKAINFLNPKEHEIPFVTSNIIDLKKRKPMDDYGVAPYKIIEKDQVKIGIVALTSFEKVDKDHSKDFTGFLFEDPILSFLKTKKIFQQKGVNIIVLMPSVENYDELKRLVKRLPPNSVDVIISGNTYTTNTQVQGIPLLQNPGKGQYISRIGFVFDTEDRVVIRDKIIQYQPTKICHNFYEITMDCHQHSIKELTEARKKLIIDSQYKVVPAKFLGHEVKKNDRIDLFLKKQKEKSKANKNFPITNSL